MPTWMLVTVWALQIVAVFGFTYGARKRTQMLRRMAHDLMGAHSLMLKAWGVLRVHEDFDSRYTADQIREHLESMWNSYGLTEERFRKMAREAQLHAVDRNRDTAP